MHNLPLEWIIKRGKLCLNTVNLQILKAEKENTKTTKKSEGEEKKMQFLESSLSKAQGWSKC